MKQLIWEKIVKLEEAQKIFKFKGVYLHFINYNNRINIIYVGSSKARNVCIRQKDYWEGYNGNCLTQYYSINLDSIEDNPFNYLKNQVYEKSIRDGVVITPEQAYNYKDFDLLKRIRKNFAQNLWVSAAKVDDLDNIYIYEKALQIFLIRKTKIAFYKSGNLIGLTKRDNLIDEGVIINIYPSEYKEWFKDLDKEIFYKKTKYAELKSEFSIQLNVNTKIT